MPIVLAVAVSSHNLVPLDGTMGMRGEYYAIGTHSPSVIGCFSSFFFYLILGLLLLHFMYETVKLVEIRVIKIKIPVQRNY